MNKSFFTCLIAGFSMLLGTQSKATMFTDLDTINQQLTAATSLNSYSGEFNIVEKGFVPGYHIVSAAGITFSLTDNTGVPVTKGFTIDLDGKLSDSQYTSFLVLGDTQVSIDLLASLNADGILSYSVTATSGDFLLESAKLCAEASEPSRVNPVPDTGSTLALGGLTLVFFLAARWRIFKRC